MAETTPEATPRTRAKKTAKKSPEKTAAKKTVKKAPAPKAAAKKSPAKKTPAKKTAARKPAPREASVDSSSQDAGRRRTPTGARAALMAAEQLVELTGKQFEGIVGISKTEDGWTAQVEILEMRRIPDTTDVLAVYEVSVDRDGDLLGYRRADRYTRGSAGEERR